MIRVVIVALALLLMPVERIYIDKPVDVFDRCPNRPGIQREVPGGFVLVINEDGTFACIHK